MVRKLKSNFGGAGGGNQAALLKRAQEMQQKMNIIQDELKGKVLEASVGGGAVIAKANGIKELIDIKISKDVIDVNDIETLEDLILSAVREVMRQAEELNEKEMSKLTGGLDMAGLLG